MNEASEKQKSARASDPTSVALTIAGSDSGGCAGIQADLKTFQHLGVFGVTAITLVTAQNTLGVHAVGQISGQLISDQIKAVAEDFSIGATKTGALGDVRVVELVSDIIKTYGFKNLVVDPVMVSKHGGLLADQEAIGMLKGQLLPEARLVTPNIREAQILTGIAINNIDDMEDVARAILDFGADAVFVKGSGLKEKEALDLFFDGKDFVRVVAPTLVTQNTHGAGCTLSAAITAFLARGEGLVDATRLAKDYVHRAIANAPGLGRGYGPVSHSA